MSKNGSFYIVQLQIIHLLNLQCTVPLMRGPSAIAKPLVCIPCILASKNSINGSLQVILLNIN